MCMFGHVQRANGGRQFLVMKFSFNFLLFPETTCKSFGGWISRKEFLRKRVNGNNVWRVVVSC